MCTEKAVVHGDQRLSYFCSTSHDHKSLIFLILLTIWIITPITVFVLHVKYDAFIPTIPSIKTQLFKNSEVEYEYLGCFETTGDSFQIEKNFTLKELNCPRRCVQLCNYFGYKNAGLHRGYECFCGYNPESVVELNQLYSGLMCNLRCPNQEIDKKRDRLISPHGDQSSCGGKEAMDLYAILMP